MEYYPLQRQPYFSKPLRSKKIKKFIPFTKQVCLPDQLVEKAVFLIASKVFEFQMESLLVLVRGQNLGFIGFRHGLFVPELEGRTAMPSCHLIRVSVQD